MEQKLNLEVYGYIVKEENLETIDYNILPGTFVVENLDPFPSYHGHEMPQEKKKPGHIFLITRKKYPGEKLMRITQKIQKFSNYQYVMDRAEIHVFNEPYHAIRIKNLTTYELIAGIQKWYNDEGIELMRQKKVKTLETTKVKKYFSLTQMEEGFYHDNEEPHIYYIEIQYQFNWSLFDRISEQVRNSLASQVNFDAAYGSIYRMNGVKDVIRLYAENLDIEKLKNIRNKYNELISKV